MKYIVLCFSSLMFFTGIFAQDQDENTQLKEQIKRLDLAHALAIFKSDAAALDSLMDDNVTVNHPTNRVVKEKKELLQLIREGIVRYTAFQRSPETFLFYKDMVIVMGTEVVVPAKGAPNAGKTIHRRYTNVWMKNNNRWQLVARHANNVCKGM
jgi:ketosteroid isomerase-like protein